jgi:uncharacterized protein (TIGR03437 family)
MKLSRIRTALLAILVPTAALADISGSQTLSSGAVFSFDTGKAASPGDIQFTGSAINFQGSAKGGNLGALGLSGQTAFNTLNQQTLQAIASLGSQTPIQTSALTAGTSNGSIIALESNGGHFGALLVTALSSSSISFQYVTFGVSGGGGGPAAPTITSIQNGSSAIPAGFPNSGIAPSMLFAIEGSNLSDPNAAVVNQDSTKGLPTTLNGTSVKVVASDGKTYTPALYHALSFEVAGVLPAATPTGMATVTVSYGGQSASAQVNIVPSAYGIDNYSGNTAVVTDAVSYALITPTSSAKPNQIVAVWGTGLGSDPQDSDTTSNGQQHAISTPVAVWVGNTQAATPAYSGEGFYPGVHIVIFTIPANAPTGCFVPIAVVTGSGANAVVSNTPTIPIMPNGGVCQDAYTGLSGSQISTLAGQMTVRSGSVIVGQSTSQTSGSNTTNDIAIANFQSQTGSGTIGAGGFVSPGSCALSESLTSSGSSQTTGLNAGTITVTPPGGSPITLQAFPQVAGEYYAQLSSGSIPQSGGTFGFNATGASGNNSVGAFSTTVNFPNPIISWTNQSASATVTRSSGQTFTWTGGAPGSYVILSGSSSSNSVSGSYTCIAPQSAGSFTVPQYILLGLPAGTGTSGLENANAFNTFTATGLDFGYALGFVAFSANTTWK